MNQTEIARKLGISQSAVSLVLKDPATNRVSEEKKALIIRFLMEGRNMNAAGRKRNWNIGYITDPLQDLHQDFFQDSLRGIEEETARNHYNLILECFQGRQLNLLQNRKADGLIIRSGKAYEFLRGHAPSLPLVLLNCSVMPLLDDIVMPDNRGGMLRIARYLMEKQCRKAAFLGCQPNYSPYSCNYHERKEGFIEACQNLGIEWIYADAELPVGRTDHLDQLDRLLSSWLKLRNPPGVIVTVNHFYAAMIRHLHPEIEVIAGDNKMEKGVENRDFPMLIQDAFYMGKLAAELLMKRIADPSRQNVRINCDMELVFPK